MSVVRRPRPRVQLIYGSGGGGHKASTDAVETALKSSPYAAHFVVDRVDGAAVSGASFGDALYNVLLSYNAVSAIEFMHSFIQFFMPLAEPSLRATFRKFWRTYPDLSCVVSFIPMLNSIFAETLPPHVTLLTVFTDFSHTPPHPWIQHPRQHLVVGTDVSYSQALSHGYMPAHIPSPSHRVTNTTGMVVHPRFYNRPTAAECAKKRLDMGLNPALFTVLILFGGSPPTDRVVRLVDLFMSRPASRAVNVITVCAKNNQLYDRLRRRRQKKPRELLYVTAYSSEIPLFMHISDLLIGKPGPGVVSEAYVTRLPFILITGRSEHHVMQQERDVLAWVRRNEIGQIVHTDREAAAITFDTITTMKEHIAAQRENRAVFEVRDLILKSLGFDPLPRHADDNPDMAGGVDMSEIAAYVPVISSMDLASADSSASSSTSSVEADKLGTRATRQRTGGDSGMSPTTITVAAPSSNPKRQDLLPSTRATFPVNTEQNRDIAAHKKTAA